MAVAQYFQMIHNYMLDYSVHEMFVFQVVNIYLRHSIKDQSKTKNARWSYLHDLLLLLMQAMNFISCSHIWILNCMTAP